MGLRVCPDVDSVLYALAGLWDVERGWGRRGDTFGARDVLATLGAAEAWFGVGDADLGLHLARAQVLRRGRPLTDAIDTVRRALGADAARVLPASDEPAETRLTLVDGRTLHFQEWYVRERADPRVKQIHIGRASASPSMLEAIGRAGAVVLGPSNPIASIGTILALDGATEAVRQVPLRIAVSPVVNASEPTSAGIRHHARARGALLAATGLEDSPASIARLYADLVNVFVIDRVDRAAEGAVHALGLRVELTDLLDADALSRALADLVAAA
jgi:LPPG:FO 2-phospho-L-lactate transferase